MKRKGTLVLLLINIITLLGFGSGCEFKRSSLFFDTGHSTRGPATTGSEIVSFDYEVVPQLPDRFYVESTLKDIFAVSPGTPEAQMLESLILFEPSLGGGCDLYGASEKQMGGNTFEPEFKRAECKGALTESLDSNINPGRFAQTIKTCDALVMSPNGFSGAMSKIIPGWQPNMSSNRPTKEKILIAYALFDPIQVPPDGVLLGLLDLANSVEQGDEAWRWVLKALCESPETIQSW